MHKKLRSPLAGGMLAGALIGLALLLAVAQLGAFEYQPQMQAALRNLREAEENLQRADADKGGHRARAIEFVREAEREVQAGIDFDNLHNSPGERRESEDSRWHGRLSPDDQRHFDSYYSHWLEVRRSSDRDEIINAERRMWDIMARNHIAWDIAFEEIASNGGPRYDADDYRWRGHLPPDDQRRFDSYYTAWVEYRHASNGGEMINNEKHLREIMSHNNIPQDVPFERIASRR